MLFFSHRVCWETVPCGCCCCLLSTSKPWTCSRRSSSREWVTGSGAGFGMCWEQGSPFCLCPQVWSTALALWGPDQPPASPGPQCLEHWEGEPRTGPGEALQVTVQEGSKKEGGVVVTRCCWAGLLHERSKEDESSRLIQLLAEFRAVTLPSWGLVYELAGGSSVFKAKSAH